MLVRGQEEGGALKGKHDQWRPQLPATKGKGHEVHTRIFLPTTEPNGYEIIYEPEAIIEIIH